MPENRPENRPASNADSDPLGGKLSLGNRRWTVRGTDERLAMAISQRLGVPEIVGGVLARRGIGLDEAEDFLEPKLKTHLPDPAHLLDMEKAATRVAQSIIDGELIGVFGDYDVDGATSSALLQMFITAAGGKVTVYIPDRIKEGYGPNIDAMKKLKDKGAKIVITVDCGTTAFEPLKAASDMGLDVVVVDHHEAETALPNVLAVVNPKRLDEKSPHTHMAAVGVTFLLCVQVNRVLREKGWYNNASRAEPDLTNWLDVVALGTVCDVVALKGVNRALVAQGLKVLAGRNNIGLKALADASLIKETPTAYHLGFVLGPRINAGGRVGASDLGTRLLSTTDISEASEIAARLNQLNVERQEIETSVLEQAILQVEGRIENDDPGPFVVAYGDGWHPGVIGIVASRLKDRFNRPAAVIGFTGDVGTASARSVYGADLGSAVIAARQAGLIEKGGGHAMAAGFSVLRENLKKLEEFIAKKMREAIGDNPPPPGLVFDGMIALGGANTHLVKSLESVAPFGVGNAEPRFIIKNTRFVEARPVGADQSHVRLVMVDEAGNRLTGIAFRAQDSDLGPGLLGHGGKPFHVAGKLRINEWQGRESAQLIVEDAAPAW
ncbi:MAG: single-stranded-DNA-specific exonuclease RecJ [Rhodospirillaceae bacterium]|nr:single-stranded-DNA-specific exonuclease RecJ [Rhodospirillaceae bacterium]